MGFINNFKNIFSGKKEDIPTSEPSVNTEDIPTSEISVNTEDKTIATSSELEGDKPFSQPEPPAMRRVIRVPSVSDDLFPPNDPDKVLIKAQPTTAGDQCLFMSNRPLFPGYSWWFPSFESAEGSPLAERLFSLEDIETILVNEATITVTRKDKTVVDWKSLAGEVGASLRELLEEGELLLSEKITNEMPSQDEIQEGIQKAIDEEVNPGVAGHGGLITLQKIKGNTITIQMGGGCQGCSAADLTLKQGIHGSFRKFVPQVGAIFDETDHAAGVNPYF